MAKKDDIKPISRELVYLHDFDEEADKVEKNWGKTDRYSFGRPNFDTYFGGGYGRKDNYEIVLLFGDTGIGKSTFALNMLIDPLSRGEKIGLLVLEDDGVDVNIRMRKLLGKSQMQQYSRAEQLHFTPPDVVNGRKLWGLDGMLSLIESWFKDRKLDIILLDHIQFAFESATALKGENEWIAQRIFVRKLNYIVRKYKKTVILVSHINKNATAKGMARITGSGGIAGSATKVIEVHKDQNSGGVLLASYHKSRFTHTPDHSIAFRYDMDGLIVGPDLPPQPTITPVSPGEKIVAMPPQNVQEEIPF